MNLALEKVRLPLAHFDLEVDATLTTQVTALFGASGAGKTSLLEIVAGLRRPSSGRGTLENEGLTDAGTRRLVPPECRGIGYVPQDDALFPHLNVRENLLYGARPGGPRAGESSYEHVTSVLEISALAGRRIGTLSGGERQRVALGRALLAAPRLLLLDEPLGRLDAPLKERLLPYLRRVREEFTLPIVLVTHAADEVVALCDEALVIDRGRIVARGPVSQLFEPSSQRHFQLRTPAASTVSI